MLKRIFGTIHAVAEKDPQSMTDAVAQLVREDKHLRSQAISIGIPILMPDGKTLLCADRGRRDHRWEWQAWDTSPDAIDRWCEMEWIDLRVQNMARWKQRMQDILRDAACVPNADFDSSSGWGRAMFDAATWELDPEINLGEVAGWIFSCEEKGQRHKG